MKKGQLVKYKNRKNKEQLYVIDFVCEESDLVGVSKVSESGEVSNFVFPVKNKNLILVK